MTRMTRLGWVLLALLILFLVQGTCASYEAHAAERTRRTTTFTVATAAFRSAGQTCWRGTVPGTSPARFGPRANWAAFLEWCGDGRVTKRLLTKRCYDRGGGIFSYDRTVECSRSAVGFKNLHITETLRYTRTIWTPFPVEIVRFAHTSIWLGPKGGMSGSYWWSS